MRITNQDFTEELNDETSQAFISLKEQAERDVSFADCYQIYSLVNSVSLTERRH